MSSSSNGKNGFNHTLKNFSELASVIDVESLPPGPPDADDETPSTIDSATTIADGIAVRQVGALTYPLFEKYVNEIVSVEEEEIAMAILWLLENVRRP